MGKLFVRWFVSALAIGVVAWMLPGIHVGRGSEGLWTMLVGAALLGLANTIVKPILLLLSCPLILLSLGLFLFVINAWMLMLASSLSQSLGFPFYVDGWGTALIGSILISIVNWLLSTLLPISDQKENHHE